MRCSWGTQKKKVSPRDIAGNPKKEEEEEESDSQRKSWGTQKKNKNDEPQRYSWGTQKKNKKKKVSPRDVAGNAEEEALMLEVADLTRPGNAGSKPRSPTPEACAFPISDEGGRHSRVFVHYYPFADTRCRDNINNVLMIVSLAELAHYTHQNFPLRGPRLGKGE